MLGRNWTDFGEGDEIRDFCTPSEKTFSRLEFSIMVEVMPNPDVLNKSEGPVLWIKLWNKKKFIYEVENKNGKARICIFELF